MDFEYFFLELAAFEDELLKSLEELEKSLLSEEEDFLDFLDFLDFFFFLEDLAVALNFQTGLAFGLAFKPDCFLNKANNSA